MVHNNSRLFKVALSTFLLVAVAPALLAGGGWSQADLMKAVDRPASVQAPLWNEAMGELAAGIDGHGMVVAEHILLQPAMQKMIPQDERKKLCRLVGSKPIPTDQFLMAIAAWGHGVLDEMLKRNPSEWWSPGNSGGPCACEWVKDRECCQRATTCQWQSGFCGCI